MKVNELREILDSCNPDAEVRLGTQPGYPFQWNVAGVIDGNLIAEYALDDAVPTEDEQDVADALNVTADFNGPVDPDTVYILEGTQLGYFTGRAWEAVR